VTSISGISAISGSFSAYPVQGHRPPRPPKDDNDDAVSKALGLSSDALRQKLENGQSLNDVAGEQGVSHDDLIAAIKANKPAGAPEPNPGGVSDDAFAEKIASQQGMPQDEGKMQRLGQLLDENAEQLKDLSPSELVQQLKGKGVDLDQLRNVLNSGDLLDVRA
jgi:hypothetical protein